MAQLKTGQVAITGTAQALVSTQYESDQFVVRAPSTNTNPVYFGAAGVTTATGHMLEPGDEFAVLNEKKAGEQQYDLDPHEFFVVGIAGADKVTWVAWVR